MCREVPFGVTLQERAFFSLVFSKVYCWILSVSALWYLIGSFPWTLSLLIRPLPEGGLFSFVPVLFVLLAHFFSNTFSSVFMQKAAFLWGNLNWPYGRGHNFCLQKPRMPLAGLVYFLLLLFSRERILFDQWIWHFVWWEWGYNDEERHLWENATWEVYQW